MKKRILCYGDSNTYGHDPRGMFGSRLPVQSRWTGILALSCPWEILSMGLNGRTIPHCDTEYRLMDSVLTRSQPLDGIVIMLGTNDMQTMFRPTAEKITIRMEKFLIKLQKHPCFQSENPPWILLLAPPILDLSWWEEKLAAKMSALSASVNQCFGQLAQHMGIYFADTAQWNIPTFYDGTHFSEEGHQIFAQRLRQVLDEIITESKNM